MNINKYLGGHKEGKNRGKIERMGEEGITRKPW